MGTQRFVNMATLKMTPLRAMFLASVLLLSHATCVSAEVSQHLGAFLAGAKADVAKTDVAAMENKCAASCIGNCMEPSGARPIPGNPSGCTTISDPDTTCFMHNPGNPRDSRFIGGKPFKSAFNWAQCRSEGGDKDCAKCKGGRLARPLARGEAPGALPCDVIPMKMDGKPLLPLNKVTSDNCLDQELHIKGSFFMVSGAGPGRDQAGWGGTPECQKFTTLFGLKGIVQTTYFFPCMYGTLVATKALIAHPHQTKESVGVVMFKRTVIHKCTGAKPEFYKEGDEVADVFKQGFCVRCPTKAYSYNPPRMVKQCSLYAMSMGNPAGA